MESTSEKATKGIRSRLTGLSAKQRLTLVFGVLAVVAALVISGVGLAPQSSSPLLTLGAQANNTSSAAADSKRVAGMMMPFMQYRYELAGDFTSQPAGTEVYRLKRAGDPKVTLLALAKALELNGEVKPLDENGWGPGNFYVGTSDWSGPTVTIGSTGMGSWSFNDPTAYPQCTTTDSNAKDVSCDISRESNVTPNFPSNDAAAEQARRIFAAGGLTVSASEIKIVKDDYSMSATAALEVEGAATALTWQASWSVSGKLSYAYGQSVTVEKVTDVPVIDAKRAVERLGDWRWSGQPAESFYPVSPIAYSDSGRVQVGSTGGSADASGSSDSNTGSTPAATESTSPPDTSASEVPEDLPTPEIKTFFVNKATNALLLIWDSNGDAWLVPGFVFEGEEGYAGAIMAVADGVIKLPDANDGVMPMVK